MKPIKKYEILFVVLSVILVGLGCDLTTKETPTVAPTPIIQVVTATGQVVQPTFQAPTPSPSSDTLSSAQKQQLAHATVRIVLMKKSSGKLVPLGSGSGTILSKDGLILTNCHVADPVAIGYPEEDNPDALVIELVDTEDQPPVPMYTAKLLASDATLDLAVIKIDKNLDGSPVNSASLNLPFTQIGDSDTVQFGDPVYVFGFPGIGGQTITYTSGSVSGFDTMEPIGNRAWMKTDATIAGGNSGGLAANTRAQIIGVPTRLGTSSATNMTDCRQIADTNGDGVINEKDTCVPTGGFINAIRPVNWAKALIEAGQKGVAYTSPYEETSTPTTTPPKNALEQFELNDWSTAIDQNNCPTQPVNSFPSGTVKIYGVFQFSNMTGGEDWSYRWLLDNRQVFTDQSTWKNQASGSCFSFSLENQGDALPDGEYRLEIFAGSSQDPVGSATTQVGGMPENPQSSGDVQLKGLMKDANSGKGIGDIYMIILNPGVDPDQWLSDGSDSDILTYTQSLSDGSYVLPDLLPRGQRYGAVAGNKKLGYQSVTGYIDVTNDDPDIITLTIELSK
jgi:serine protease Do